MTPPTISELIFSEQANHNFSKTLGEIKRHTLSIQNRLQSILEDAAFVQRVSAAYGRPLIANERCGSWYIDPTYKDGNAYFKSTDGHTGVWSFSMRRLNTHLLETIGNHDGCVAVSNSVAGRELRRQDALLWILHVEESVCILESICVSVDHNRNA
jgi:tRNA A64-2'-O-ribosylphosphate transferase